MTAPQMGASPPASPALSVPEQNDGSETRSVGAIVSDISSDLSDLVRKEMDLAKTEFKSEFKSEAKDAAKGAGMFGAAGLAGFFALLFTSLAVTYLLDNVMPIEVAALITALLWGVTAAVMAKTAKKRIREADLKLPKTQQTLKEDLQWAKAQKN